MLYKLISCLEREELIASCPIFLFPPQINISQKEYEEKYRLYLERLNGRRKNAQGMMSSPANDEADNNDDETDLHIMHTFRPSEYSEYIGFFDSSSAAPRVLVFLLTRWIRVFWAIKCGFNNQHQRGKETTADTEEACSILYCPKFRGMPQNRNASFKNKIFTKDTCKNCSIDDHVHY